MRYVLSILLQCFTLTFDCTYRTGAKMKCTTEMKIMTQMMRILVLLENICHSCFDYSQPDSSDEREYCSKISQENSRVLHTKLIKLRKLSSKHTQIYRKY